MPAITTNVHEFSDPSYGYSLSIPTAWRPYQRALASGPPARLSLCTPNNNTLLVSVQLLPRPVADEAEFESVGRDHVDALVKTYLNSFNIPIIFGSKKENHSDHRSMRFWQGTSGLYNGVAPAMLISLHAISYRSNCMVNVVYASGRDSLEEVRTVDAIMKSLTFKG
jgi:hypothetical protein